MRILVTGSSGLIGSALVPTLELAGHDVLRLTRVAAAHNKSHLFWNPDAGILDRERLEGFDAIVNLAGDSIADGRWTPAKKARIRESRVRSTQLISQTVALLVHRPKVLVSASAIGFYGNRGVEILTEESLPGTDFLAGVCRDWEMAVEPVIGIRTVSMRFGMVLSRDGGALRKMLTPFHLGLGGKVGTGRQFWSWIALDDAVAAIRHILATEILSGPVNVVSPQPIVNLEFTKALGRVLARPVFFSVPAFAARIAFGEMADALLLASARVQPQKLVASGFAFRHPELDGALRHLLRK